MEDRREILLRLIEYSLPISELSDELVSLNWDYEGPSVTLGAKQLTKVLRRFLAGELNDLDVESWADLIECRDGINYETELTKEVIHTLSNPALHGQLSVNSCNKLISNLKSD